MKHPEKHPDQHDLDILSSIERYWNEQGIGPSDDEIAQSTGNHKNFVFRRLEILESLGYVRKVRSKSRGKARGIILLRTADGLRFVGDNYEIGVLGYIAAGEPIPLPHHNAEPLRSILVPRWMIQNPKDIYALEVRGDSMKDVSINHGDLILIRYQRNAENGALIAARWWKDPTNPVTTLKRYKIEGNQIWLKPENSDYARFSVEPDQLEIQGIVVRVLRNTEDSSWNRF
ncbi:MAG: repressor LexA [Chloroflexi bacterium]|nr:repressor LexA [Chloroflexota bacterium]